MVIFMTWSFAWDSKPVAGFPIATLARLVARKGSFFSSIPLAIGGCFLFWIVRLDNNLCTFNNKLAPCWTSGPLWNETASQVGAQDDSMGDKQEASTRRLHFQLSKL
jgi:hypothetical protein